MNGPDGLDSWKRRRRFLTFTATYDTVVTAGLFIVGPDQAEAIGGAVMMIAGALNALAAAYVAGAAYEASRRG